MVFKCFQSKLTINRTAVSVTHFFRKLDWTDAWTMVWSGSVFSPMDWTLIHYPQDRHTSQRCMLAWQMPQPKVEVESESVDTRQLSCQHSDLSHVSQHSSQQSSKHETCEPPHATQQLIQWKTCDSSHTSQIFQCRLRVPHSTTTMKHHLQGQVVPTST